MRTPWSSLPKTGKRKEEAIEGSVEQGTWAHETAGNRAYLKKSVNKKRQYILIEIYINCLTNWHTG